MDYSRNWPRGLKRIRRSANFELIEGERPEFANDENELCGNANVNRTTKGESRPAREMKKQGQSGETMQ